MLALVVLPHGDLEIAPAAVLAFGLALSSASCGRSSEGAVLLAPEVSNLGLRATRVALADGLLVIEGNEDGVDLNRDGDGVDAILRIQEPGTARETLIADASSSTLGAGFVAFLVEESGRSEDLNADGKTYNTGLAVRPEAAEHLAFEQRTLVILVSEEAQGRDLDDDQDLLDDVLHLVRVP